MAQVVEAPGTAEDLLKQKQTLTRRVHGLLHSYPALSPLVVLVLAFIVFSIWNSNFAQPRAVSLMLQEVAVTAALAVGQTLIILTAGIDLSVGALMILAAYGMGKLTLDHGVPGFLAFVVGMIVALIAAGLNGTLVTRIKLPPFIVTLGTLSIFTALSLIYAQGTNISLPTGSFLNFTGRLFNLGSFTLTYGVVVMLLLYVVFSFVLKQTAWGRHLYATGDDPEAARLAGIRTSRVLLSAYLVAGAVYGIAAWIYIGRIYGVDPNGATNANLESITAVVIGGTSLFGGRGVIVGSLIGALIVQVFENGLSIAGVDSNYQVLTVGILVVAAVAVDQWIRSVKL